jgi:hypothetical protein
MKKVIFLLMAASSLSLYAQDPIEKEIKSEVSEVTVYLENALETRKVSVDVLPGKTLLKFTGLSPFIDAKSIQAKVDGDVTLLTVNHQQNFLTKSDISAERKALQEKLVEVDKKISAENAYLEVIEEDLAFLKENRDLGGTQSVSMAAVKEGADFFSTRTTTLKLKKMERNQTLEDLNRQRNDLVSQLDGDKAKKEFATGEILVLVESKKSTQIKTDLAYLVSNASWYPSYDIRANNITDPLEIIYKANIRQDTKSDWKNVKLKLSSYNPTISGVAPELQTYFLDFNSRPPVYNPELSSVSGQILDQNGEALPGVTIRVKNTNVATVSNAQGFYSLTLPANSRTLEYNLIGYLKQTRTANSSVLDVRMSENAQMLQEVAVAAYGAKVSSIDDALLGRVAGLDVSGKQAVRIRGVSAVMDAALPEQEQIEKPISVDFDIKVPYTVKSDNKVVTVEMDKLNLPALFQYYAIPKLNKDVFLTAQIRDWEKYSFLAGEANVFFEDMYVGKTVMDVSSASDTLSISLGVDKKISAQREKVKDYVVRQVIGSKKVESREWKTTVRNSRSESINLLLLDQVPVSTNAEIEVSNDLTPNAQVNAETGEVRWEKVINPGQNHIFDLKYSVKYPKNKRLIIE